MLIRAALSVTKSNLRIKACVPLYSSQVTVCHWDWRMAGSWRPGPGGRNWKQKPWRNAVLILTAGFACFLISPRTHCLGLAPAIISWAHPHQSLIKKMHYRLAYRQISWRDFLSRDFLFPNDFGFLTSWHKTIQNSWSLVNLTHRYKTIKQLHFPFLFIPRILYQ